MCECKTPLAVAAVEVPPRTKPSNYPGPFFSRMARREKRPLGDVFGLKNFGVNLTTLEPSGETALMHSHSKQDEMIYILQGSVAVPLPVQRQVLPVLLEQDGRQQVRARPTARCRVEGRRRRDPLAVPARELLPLRLDPLPTARDRMSATLDFLP